MEFRYVYRRVEDVIGSPLVIKDSPHGRLTRQLRYAFREHRDVAHHTEVTAMCLASMGGNPSIDASKMGSEVSMMLDRSLEQKIPYLKQPEEKPASKSMYDEYFKQLAEFTAERNKAKEAQKKEMTASAEET